MPANYPRTTSTKYRRNMGRSIESNEQKLERLAKAAEGGGVKCKSSASANSLASALNARHSTGSMKIKGLVSGYYTAIGTTVYYVAEPIKEEYEGFMIERGNISTPGFDIPYNGPDIDMDPNKAVFHSIVDYRDARDSEIREINLYPHQTGTPKRLVQTSSGEVDLNTIDSFVMQHSVDDKGNVHQIDTSLHNSALLERMDPESHMPNFALFSSYFKQYDDEQTKAEKYLEFAQNHARMIEAAHVSRLEFNTQEHITNPAEAVNAANLFSDPEVVKTFEKGNEIEVSDRYFGKVAFLHDDTQERKNREANPITSELKDAMGDSHLAYNEPDPMDPNDRGTVFVKDSIDKDFFVNGGYYHERFHGQLRETHHEEFQELEQLFELQKEHEYRDQGNLQTASQISRMNTILSSFEEVASDVRTYEFMGRDQKFAEQVYKKYEGINPNDPRTFNLYISSQWEKNGGTASIAEAISIIRYIDPENGDAFIETLKSWGDNQKVDEILELTETFSKCYDPHSFSPKALLNALMKCREGGTG